MKANTVTMWAIIDPHGNISSGASKKRRDAINNFVDWQETLLKDREWQRCRRLGFHLGRVSVSRIAMPDEMPDEGGE